MKNNDKLFDEIGKLDDEFIPAIVKEKNKKTPLIIGSTAAAAVAVFAVLSLGTEKISWEKYQIYPPYDYRENIAVRDELPQIYHGILGGIIYWEEEAEAVNNLYRKEEAEENAASNPWDMNLIESGEIKQLPVFKNNYFDNYDIAVHGHLSEERLTEMLNNTAASMGLTAENQEFYYEDYSELPVWLSGDCFDEKYGGDTHIVVYGNGDIRIWFNFHGSGAYCIPEINGMNDDEAFKLLTERFGDLIQYKNPTPKSKNKRWSSKQYVLYDGSDDPVQNILNYCSANATFIFSEENPEELTIIELHNNFPGLECIAEYPIITVEKAKEFLKRSCYLKRFPDSFFKNGVLSMEDVISEELIYYSTYDEYFKPYYRFYIELGYKDSDGNTLYGDIYVPAIEGRYITANNTAPDFTGKAYEAFPDTIALPDGSTADKSEACGVYMEDGIPTLIFNFGFMRYAEPVCFNTLYYPDCYNFENGTFNKERYEINTETDPKYFMVKAGDSLGSIGAMTIAEAKYTVALKNGEVVFHSCNITVNDAYLEGMLTCEPKELQPGEIDLSDPPGILYLYVDPVDRNERPVPLIYDPEGAKNTEKILDEAFILTGGFKCHIGEASVAQAHTLGYREILDGTKCVSACADVSRLTFSSDSGGVNVYAALSEFGVYRNLSQ